MVHNCTHWLLIRQVKSLCPKRLDGLESAQVMTTKDERIGIRVPSETKHSLLQIARKEGRSLAQVCEILLRAGIHSYEKEGTKYLHRFIPETRGKNPAAGKPD
jgi:hypothetical protein